MDRLWPCAQHPIPVQEEVPYSSLERAFWLSGAPEVPEQGSWDLWVALFRALGFFWP